MIVTVTLNPALHVSYETEQVRLGGANPVRRVSYRTGGRGLAVARVLHTFGHEVVAAGLAGGASGEMIRAELARAGVATQFTWISGESRRVVEVAGPAGDVTAFCEPAPYITTEELGRLAADYRSLMADATAAVLSGSLPAGLPAETYGSLATYAAEAGVPVVLDAGGSALWHAVSRRPALVIPEPEDKDPEALIANGARAVAVLSGGRVSAITAEGRWSAELVGQHAASPRGTPERSRVGAHASRETLPAGFVPGIALSWSWPDILAHAVALAASSGPAGEVDLEAYERLLPNVVVTLVARWLAAYSPDTILRPFSSRHPEARLYSPAVSHASEQAGQEAGGELERRQGSVPVPDSRDGPRSSEAVTVINWSQLTAWARGRGVVLAGLVLIVAQLIWKSFFLGHFYFWQDDFHFTELALSHSFSWSYLTVVGAGHLFPGVNALVWVVARLSPYDWALASAVTVVMLAAAGLAALRLLRTLFGNRPAILVPLTVYLLCPLTMPNIRWWATAIESLPLEIAIFMALNAQVNYVRTGRFRHAVAAAAWLLFGLAFFEKALVVPLLLLGVTSGFLMDESGSWLRAIGHCLVRYWRAWLLQVAVLAGYAVVFATSLHTSSVQPEIPGTAGGVFTFISKIVKNTFVPGAIGGPWQWLATSDAEYAYSGPPPALAWLALLVAAAVIVASIWSRRHAWRAWAILAGWLAAADIAPVLVGRVPELGPGVLALETRYVADAVPVLAICLGLAFWPVAGKADAAGRRWLVVSAGQLGNVGTGQLGRTAAAGLVGAFVIGSLWSVQSFENVTTSASARAYIANARTALGETPEGTVIVDSRVPSTLMIGTFGSYANASAVLRPLESAGSAARIHWTSQPDGTIDRLMVFGSDGRLRQAGIYGPGSVPFPTTRRCQPVRRGRSIVRFTSPTAPGTRMLHLAYLATVAESGRYLTVSYGSQRQVLAVEAGLHNAYLPERGSADSVTLSGAVVAAGLCVGGVQAGIIAPSSTGPVIPAVF